MPRRIVQIEPRSKSLSRQRCNPLKLLWLAALLAAIAGGLATPACSPKPQGAAPQAQAQGPGGPFNLVDQDGKPADQSVLKGKWSVVFFGYTFCPDFCPTTLTKLGRVMTELGPKANNVQVVFITVDPARDTPRQLKTYLASPVFPKRIIGLTGAPDKISQAARAYDVYYQKSGEGADYTVDHSTALYLMDPNGDYRAVIADGGTPAEMSQQISQAMAGA